MNRVIVHTIQIVALLPFLANCSTKVRYPFCSEGETPVPAELSGRYRLTMLQPTGETGLFQPKDVVVYIKPQEQMAYMSNRGIRALRGLTGGILPLADDPSAEPPVGTICNPDGKGYISQTRNLDSTYTLASLMIDESGFTLGYISFDHKSLDSLSVKYHYFPSLKGVDGGWQFSVGLPLEVVVENRQVDRLRLMTAMRITALSSLRFVRLDEEEDRKMAGGKWIPVMKL